MSAIMNEQRTALESEPRQSGVVVSLDAEALLIKAIDANVPVESLEKLLAMRAELKREQAQTNYNRALVRFQSGVPPITKDKTVNVRSHNGVNYSYRYADIGSIQRAIAPQLSECGLSVTFDTRQQDSFLNVACIVHHIDGHSERTEFPALIDRQARMNDTQKIGSALTYGRRYALCAALGIVTAEEDDDGNQGQTQTYDTNNPEATAMHPSASPPSGNAPHDQTCADRPRSERGAPNNMPPMGQGGAPRLISESQHCRAEGRINELRLDRDRVKNWTAAKWGVQHFPDLNQPQYAELDARLEDFAGVIANENQEL